MKRLHFIYLGLFIILSSFALHKFYMSITHVNYVEDNKSVQITIRVFIDDLQTELNLYSTNKNIELATDREPKNIDSLYQNYLNEKFKIQINSSDKYYAYIGKKYDHDMVVFYLEAENILEIKTINIENKILLNSFSEQENIVKTNINQKKTSKILNRNNTSTFLNYE